MTPKSGLYISFQMAPITMPGIRIGSRKIVRYRTRPTAMRLTNSASAKPISISAVTAMSANSAVLASPARTRTSRGSSA